MKPGPKLGPKKANSWEACLCYGGVSFARTGTCLEYDLKIRDVKVARDLLSAIKAKKVKVI